MKFKQTPLGFEYKTNSVLVFFGNKNCTLAELKKNYPFLNFRLIRQTHSDILIKSVENTEDIEADAHWTQEKNIALVIKTADCLPLLVLCEEKKFILAIHAGWRGVENQICLKALNQINCILPWKNPLDIYLGPHIHQKSFEVDSTVKDQLVLSSYSLNSSDFVTPSNEKCLVNLSHIVQLQIKQISDFNFSECAFDTKTDFNFHSYRRGKMTWERNLSFISLL